MKAFAPGGFDKRKPTSRKLKRSALVSVGANAEWSLDGHDKLLSAGFAIYGIRDKWSGYWLFYVVVPSNRFAAAIGVIYLQCVRKYGGKHTLMNLRVKLNIQYYLPKQASQFKQQATVDQK